MGTLRRGAFGFVAATFLAAIVAPPGWCADSSSDRVFSVQADPCFIGRLFGDVTPIALTITNRGPATHADIEVHNRNRYRASSQYHTRIDLPGDGAKTKAIVYPVSLENDRWYGSPGYTVDVDAAGHSLATQVILPNSGQTTGQIALVGDNFGAIAPSRTVKIPGDTQISELNRVQTACYVTPENAPTRAIAYAGLSTLVLGDGAERLKAGQWSAIREWIVSGGSLILLAKDYYQIPQVDALSPVTPHAPEVAELSKLPRISSEFVLDSLPAKPEKIVNGDLRPGSESLELWRNHGGIDVLIARRQLGAGTVLFFGMDPTEREFRNWAHLPNLWHTLVYQSAPVSPSVQLISASIGKAPWVSGNAPVAANSHDGAESPLNDPFQIKLPPLPSVVYVFVAYFVLAVPISFVVLKRMRRMNLAWVTGPVLAVVFGGVLYLFTARLNTAPLSRRTAGVIAAAAGDKSAHFSGDTEIFFPRSGAYNVTVPKADSIGYFLVGSDDYSGGNNSHDLDSCDDGGAMQVPEIAVANLSFRRLYHSQTIDWGGGIDGDLRHDGSSSDSFKISGTITNSTGRTINSVYISIPKHETGSYGAPILLKVPDVVPGVNDLTGRSTVEHNMDESGPTAWRNVSAPTLYGTTSAADFGPSLGRYVGGENTAQVVVSLPGLKLEGTR